MENEIYKLDVFAEIRNIIYNMNKPITISCEIVFQNIFKLAG